MEKVTGDVDRSNELVVILQEKLEEKEDEIGRLKLQLQDNDNDKDNDNGNVEEQAGLAVDDNANDERASPTEVQTEK